MDHSKSVKLTQKEFGNSNVYFSASELPEGARLPESWKNFGLIYSDSLNIPIEWTSFSNQLPWLMSLFKQGLLGTACLTSPNMKLIYIFEDIDGLYYYTGEPSLTYESAPEKLFSFLPSKLREFYENVHNGFTFHPIQSMGPLKILDFTHINSISEETMPESQYLLGFFSNGGGDYIAIDTKAAANNFYIWWHEKQNCPDNVPDIWETMDAWISIFLEDTVVQRNVEQITETAYKPYRHQLGQQILLTTPPHARI